MKYYIANWKMEMNKKDAVAWINEWVTLEGDLNAKVIVAPTFLHMSILSKTEGVKLAAQDVSEFNQGAHTGEVGAFQIKEYCDYAIVGHSERKEPYETVVKKINNCIENDIIPIVCFTNPEDVQKYYIKGVIMAWEDPANISGGEEYKPKDPKEIKETIEKIKHEVDPEMILLYGGSVNENNISEIKAIRLLDGVLVGNASLTAKEFHSICTIEPLVLD